jgi:DNA-binding transcriptional LysR family regulator
VFDVRRLVVLREVARCGSLSAAATTLNYTTSAVSQQIAALERDVGVSVLDRGPSGARLTPAGEKLLDHVDRILDAIAAAERELAWQSTAAPNVLRVASFASAAAAILPRAIAQFRVRYPRTAIELVDADPDDGVAMLRGAGVDLAVITEVPGEPTQFPDVNATPVFDDEFFVVLPTHHRLAAASEVPFAALSSEQWVVSSATGTCPDTRVFQKACSQAGFSPSVTFRAEDYSTVQGLVAANLGVSLVPSLAALGARGDVAVRRVAGQRPMRRISVAAAKQPDAGSPLAGLVSLVRSVGARLAGDAVYSDPVRPFSVA